ncbi:hypothetical protein B0H14DRAFT_3853424 [Mycena olivaceomarginata]|nr:hypothetical protein B0H14DRAFT_3853424 [Mycena olivaceomarginata]
MQRRGRSTGVSETAIARLRSQERLRPPTPHTSSRSPSPLSSASLSPRSRSPTPPLTLSDQVHIAYADDDIHLAKVLLLRLQGIEVTSDSDPRIAAVKDEDFDACFIPFGRLDDGRGEQHSQVNPPKPDPETRRAETLKAKERLWETEARRFTEERCKHATLKRRQGDRQRAADEQERIRLIRQKEAAAAVVDQFRRRRMNPTARTLNFALVPPVPTPPQKFTYDFPFTPRNIAPRATPPRNITPRRAAQPRREPTRVTFAQVLAAMQGDLFPVLPGEHTLPVSATADRTKARRQYALLDALLVAGVDLDATLMDPNGKGKRRAIGPTPQQPCVCASPASPSLISSSSSFASSSSSSGLSRAGSWLSFGTRSSRSSTGTSVASSWPSAWLPGARRTASPSPTPSLAAVQQCRCRRARDVPRTAVSVHPLLVPPDVPPRRRRARSIAAGVELGAPRDHPASQGHVPFTLALGRLAALARNLQAAYVRAVVVGYGVTSEDEWEQNQVPDGSEDVETEEHMSVGYAGVAEWASPRESGRAKAMERKPLPVPLASKLRVRSAGARAGLADVRRFLSPSSLSASSPPSPSSSLPSSPSPTTITRANPDDDLAPHAPLSLLAPAPSSARAKSMFTRPPARTPLPARPAYARVFAPPVPLPRSPWAPVPASSPASTSEAAAYGGGGDGDGDGEYPYARPPVLRARAVPNSAFLRVKALHHEALPLLDLDQVHILLGAGQTPTPRRPRECVVGLGVDRAPGSGLRFVYANARAVVV